MIVTIHQPAYLPWLGYFDKIIRSDCYVYLDTVQFEKNSFTNRNRILTPQGPLWLTVPVKLRGHMTSTMNDIEIDNGQPWRQKHLRSIYSNYKKSPRFEERYVRLEELYKEEDHLLSDLCFRHLRFWFEELGIRTRLLKASELGIDSKKSELVLDICKHLHADRYISGALGADYLDTAVFEENGIEVEFQNYAHPVYPQLWGTEFVPNLSIVDFWMNAAGYERIAEGRLS
jgi:hypothetical protein